MGFIRVSIFITQVGLFLFFLQKAVNNDNETKAEIGWWFLVGLVVISMSILIIIPWR